MTLRIDNNNINYAAINPVVMDGADYAAWTGDNITPYTFCIPKIPNITAL